MPAPKGNQNAKGNKGGGRPTKYKPEYAKMAKKIALLGVTDEQLAAIFEVSEETINAWKRAHVEFSTALREGKAIADSEVAHSLYRRAVGYRHRAVKIYADPKTGATIQVPYVEHYPPDTPAGIFWLKNRRPDVWRDKQEVVQQGDPDNPVVARVIIQDERQR